MHNYPAITNDKELLTAILYIYNDGRYKPWYHSFGSDSFNVDNQNMIIVACEKSYDEIVKLDYKLVLGKWVDKDNKEYQSIGNKGDRPWTWLECLGSNLVTDAMDPDESNPYEWEDMPQVEIITEMDKYIHNY